MFMQSVALVLVGLFCLGSSDDPPKFDVAKEMGYFASCKGKPVSYPSDMVAQGAINLGLCQADYLSSDPELAGNKFCLGMCVNEKFGYYFENRTYDWDTAIKPLLSSSIDKEIIDIQTAALKRCGVQGQMFVKTPSGCPAAEKMDGCIRAAQISDCGGSGPITTPAP